RLRGRPSAVGHRGEVWFGPNPQVEGAESATGEGVCRVGKDVGEPQVVGIARHGAKRYRLPAAGRDEARPETARGVGRRRSGTRFRRDRTVLDAKARAHAW